MPKKCVWTPEQDAFLKDNYPHMRKRDIATILGKTDAQVYTRYKKLHPVSEKQRTPFSWTMEQERIVIENFLEKSDYELAEIIGCTPSNIRTYKKNHDLYRALTLNAQRWERMDTLLATKPPDMTYEQLAENSEFTANALKQRDRQNKAVAQELQKRAAQQNCIFAENPC